MNELEIPRELVELVGRQTIALDALQRRLAALGAGLEELEQRVELELVERSELEAALAELEAARRELAELRNV